MFVGEDDGLDVSRFGGLDELVRLGWRVDEDALVGLRTHQKVRVVIVGAALQLMNRNAAVLVMWGHVNSPKR